MNEYKRICPQCGKEITYTSKYTFETANNANTLCRSCTQLNRFSIERYGDLSKLLEDTYESFYWIGFLLADGTFSDIRLGFGLSIHDKEHFEKFAKFIRYKKNVHIKNVKFNGKNYGFCSLTVQDKTIIPKVIKKFDIKYKKTYNPPSTINKWDRNFILALFTGFVDGDGCIVKKTNRKDAKLGIKTHISWLHILKEFSNILFGKDYTYVNKEGYACLGIEEFPIIRKLKLEMLNLKIPYLKRKWDRIDETYINRTELGKIIRPLIKNDFNNGMSRKQIQEKYNVSNALLTKILVYNK